MRRNPIQREVVESGRKYRTRVVRDRKKYTRKAPNRRNKEIGNE